MAKSKAKRKQQSENKSVPDIFEDWLEKQPVTHVKSRAGYVAEEEKESH